MLLKVIKREVNAMTNFCIVSHEGRARMEEMHFILSLFGDLIVWKYLLEKD